jgi:hypothetical protein
MSKQAVPISEVGKQCEKLKRAIFPNMYNLKDQGRCPFCSKHVTAVELAAMDVLSRREFRISGLCQTCQDNVFTEEEE